MSRKPTNRRPDQNRPDQKPTGPGAGTYDSGKPDAGRMPEDFPGRKGFEKPAGGPIDKPFPAPGAGGRGKDIFDAERSDRESGRPIQLEEDDTVDAERSDQEAGRPVQLDGDQRRKDRPERGPHEVESTTR